MLNANIFIIFSRQFFSLTTVAFAIYFQIESNNLHSRTFVIYYLNFFVDDTSFKSFNNNNSFFFFVSIDSEFEELETTPRYRPDSLSALSRSTRFSEAEIKRIYRGFKAECPTGVVKEDTFKIIYSHFFPQGGSYA